MTFREQNNYYFAKCEPNVRISSRRNDKWTQYSFFRWARKSKKNKKNNAKKNTPRKMKLYALNKTAKKRTKRKKYAEYAARVWEETQTGRAAKEINEAHEKETQRNSSESNEMQTKGISDVTCITLCVVHNWNWKRWYIFFRPYLAFCSVKGVFLARALNAVFAHLGASNSLHVFFFFFPHIKYGKLHNETSMENFHFWKKPFNCRTLFSNFHISIVMFMHEMHEKTTYTENLYRNC